MQQQQQRNSRIKKCFEFGKFNLVEKRDTTWQQHRICTADVDWRSILSTEFAASGCHRNVPLEIEKLT